MNLPADDATGHGADDPDAVASEPTGADAESVDPAGTVTGNGEAACTAGRDAGVTRGAAAKRTATSRILDEVFGDVLPTVTRDELDDGSDRSSGGRDQWYRDNRPPHHG